MCGNGQAIAIRRVVILAIASCAAAVGASASATARSRAGATTTTRTTRAALEDFVYVVEFCFACPIRRFGSNGRTDFPLPFVA